MYVGQNMENTSEENTDRRITGKQAYPIYDRMHLDGDMVFVHPFNADGIPATCRE